VLRQLHEREQADANLQALPTARLTQTLIQIAHGFSGSKRPAPKLEIKDFLPYHNWKPSGAQPDGPSGPTQFVLTELVKQKALPLHVFAAMMKPASEQP